MTTIPSSAELPTAYRTLRHNVTVPDDLRLVGLWSAFGLVLSDLFFVMGFGADIAQAFMAAG
jgi:hypothetical protein